MKLKQTYLCQIVQEVHVKAYLNERAETEAIMHHTLCCPVIINGSVDLFPACTNTSCQKKINIVPRENLVQCIYYARHMKPIACVNLFEDILQFENITLSLPRHVLEDFFMEDVIAEYKNMDLLIEKIIYMKNIDYQYNSRNIVTKMRKH